MTLKKQSKTLKKETQKKEDFQTPKEWRHFIFKNNNVWKIVRIKTDWKLIVEVRDRKFTITPDDLWREINQEKWYFKKDNPTTTENEEHRRKMEERKIALWHFWWRPAFYKTPQELEKAIDDFFELFILDENIIYLENKSWEVTWWDFRKVPTVTWLALHLWFKSRQSLLDYDWKKWDEKAEFSDLIKRARLMIENFNEERLLQGKWYWPGVMFNLKNNFSWKDVQNIDQTSKITSEVIVKTPE